MAGEVPSFCSEDVKLLELSREQKGPVRGQGRREGVSRKVMGGQRGRTGVMRVWLNEEGVGRSGYVQQRG